MTARNEATILKMIDSLPEVTQTKVIEHLREYIEEIREEAQWEKSYQRTSNNLEKFARQVKKEIAVGKSSPMDFSRL